ncbi:MAG: hypothetical protein AB7S61_02565 [Methanoregulaceae archaeon]
MGWRPGKKIVSIDGRPGKNPIPLAGMYDRMDESKIQKALDEMGIEDEILCIQAEEIAAKYGISRRDIGDYCTARNVKIRGCQLGCFR